MKRHSWILLAVFVVSLVSFPKNSIAKVYTNPGQEAVIDNRVEPIPPSPQVPEAERTQQLLEIWKDHVKTLTRERNEAYKEIEALKSQSAGTVQNNGSAEVSSAERESASRTIAALRSQLASLQSENQQLKLAQPRDVASVDQDLKMELGTLRSENQKLKLAIKERTETNSDKEVILREKEEALRQLDYLKDKMTLLQKKYDQLQSHEQPSPRAVVAAEENNADAAQLKLLKAKAEKLKVVETELQEARDYFASYMKDLDAKNQQIMDENNSLKSRLNSLNAN
jgi:chromosome segregation ATPase